MIRNKEIPIFIMVIIIGLALIYGLVGCKEKAEASEPNETDYIIFSDQPATIAEFCLEELGNITFTQEGEELNFKYSEPNVYTYDFEPEKAVSFIINTFHKCLIKSEDVVVRYEPNEPKRSFISFTLERDLPVLSDPLPITIYEYEDGSRLNLYREPNEPEPEIELAEAISWASLPDPARNLDADWFGKIECTVCGRLHRITAEHSCPEQIEPNEPVEKPAKKVWRWFGKDTTIYFKE